MNLSAANTLSQANTYTDTQLASYSSTMLSSANAYTDNRVEAMGRELHRAVAGSIALARASLPLNPGESGIAVGYGTSGGQNSMAISVHHATTRNLYLNAGISRSSGGGTQAGAGVGFKF